MVILIFIGAVLKIYLGILHIITLTAIFETIEKINGIQELGYTFKREVEKFNLYACACYFFGLFVTIVFGSDFTDMNNLFYLFILTRGGIWYANKLLKDYK